MQRDWEASVEGVVVFSKGEANWDSADTINLGERQKLSRKYKSHGQLARKEGGGKNFGVEQ